MKNIEKYKDIVLKSLNACDIDTLLRGKRVNGYCKGFKCNGCKERFLKWLIEEYKEPVLDDIEKAYLSAVIKPLRKMIAYIVKAQDFDDGKQCIRIILQNGDGMHFQYLDDDDSMYKGMEVNKEYTLEELGL